MLQETDLLQLVEKMKHDSSASANLDRLTRDLSESDKEYLFLDLVLLEYLPLANRFRWGWNEDETTIRNLQTCFKTGLDSFPGLARSSITRFFEAIIDEPNTTRLDEYREGLFRADDLCFLSMEDAGVVKAHVLSRLQEEITFESLFACKGIGPNLTPDEAIQFMDIVVTIFPWLRQISIPRLGSAAEMVAEKIQNMSRQSRITAQRRLEAYLDPREGPVVRELAMLAHYILGHPRPECGYFFLEGGPESPDEMDDMF